MAQSSPSRTPGRGEVKLPSVEAGSVAKASPRLHIAVDLNLTPDENDSRIAAWEAGRESGREPGAAMVLTRPRGVRQLIRKDRISHQGTRNTNEGRAPVFARPFLPRAPPARPPQPVRGPLPLDVRMPHRPPFSLPLQPQTLPSLLGPAPMAVPDPRPMLVHPQPPTLSGPPISFPAPNGRPLHGPRAHPLGLPFVPHALAQPYLPVGPVPPTYPPRHGPPTCPPSHILPTFPPRHLPPTFPPRPLPPTFQPRHLPPTFPPRQIQWIHPTAGPPPPAAAPVRRSSSHGHFPGGRYSGRPERSGPKSVEGGSPADPGRKRKR